MKLFFEITFLLISGLLLFLSGIFAAGAFSLLEGETFFVLVFSSLFLLLFTPFFSPFKKYFFLYPFFFFLLLFLFPEKKFYLILGFLPSFAGGLLLFFPSRKKEMLLLLFLLTGVVGGLITPVKSRTEKLIHSCFYFPEKGKEEKAPLFETPSAAGRGGTLLAIAMTFLQLPEEDHSSPSLLLSATSKKEICQERLRKFFSFYGCSDVQYLSPDLATHEKLKGNYAIIFFQPEKDKFALFYSLREKNFWKDRKRLLAKNGIQAFCLPFSLSKEEQKKVLSSLLPIFREFYQYNLLFETGASFLLLSSDAPLTGNRSALAQRLRTRYPHLIHTFYPPGAFALYMDKDGKDLSSSSFREEEWKETSFRKKYFPEKEKGINRILSILSLFLLPVFYFIFRFFQSGKGERKKGFRLFECIFFLTGFPFFFFWPQTHFPGGKAHLILLLLFFIGALFFSCAFVTLKKKENRLPTSPLFSRKRAFIYGITFPISSILLHVLFHSPNTFSPLWTAFLLPGAGLTFSGLFYGKNLGGLLKNFREEENKKILSLAAGGILAGVAVSRLIFLSDPAGLFPEKLLFLLLLLLFSFSFLRPSFFKNTPGKE